MPCKGCGFIPAGEDRAVAWLFSRDHLSETELAMAAGRVRAGETPDPSRALCAQARVAMGAQAPDDDRPLGTQALVALALANLLLSPLAGLAVWFGLRSERPIAGRQALRITVPIALMTTVVWAVFVLKARLG